MPASRRIRCGRSSIPIVNGTKFAGSFAGSPSIAASASKASNSCPLRSRFCRMAARRSEWRSRRFHPAIVENREVRVIVFVVQVHPDARNRRVIPRARKRNRKDVGGCCPLSHLFGAVRFTRGHDRRQPARRVTDRRLRLRLRGRVRDSSRPSLVTPVAIGDRIIREISSCYSGNNPPWYSSRTQTFTMKGDDSGARIVAVCMGCGSVYAALRTTNDTIQSIGSRSGCATCGEMEFKPLPNLAGESTEAYD